MKRGRLILGLAALLLLPSGVAGAADDPSSKQTLRGDLPNGGSVTIEVTFGERRRYDVSFDRLRMRCDDGSAQPISFGGSMTFGPGVEDNSQFGLGAQASEGYFGWQFRGRLKRPDLAVGGVSAHRLKRRSGSIRCDSGRVRWRATPTA